MGCDGGTIPRRDELVRLRKKPEQIDKHMERMAKWLNCAITQESLRQPTISCELGRLYNKEALLEFLLDKSSCEMSQHIRSLKDVKELQLTPNPEFEKGTGKNDYPNSDISQYICPVTGLQMNGHYKFCFLWGCGCVLSEKALKEVKSEVCHKCGVPYHADDAIILNGTPEDISALEERMEARRAKAKAEKKSKKAPKRKADATDVDHSPKESKVKNDKLTNGHSASSELTNERAASSERTNGTLGLPKPKAASTSKGVTTGGGSSKSVVGDKDRCFDQTKSAVYKSLFLPKGTKNGGNQAHWVTYNPYYAMSK